MRFHGQVRKVAPIVVATVFGYALCSIPLNLVGGTIGSEDRNNGLNKGEPVIAEKTEERSHSASLHAYEIVGAVLAFLGIGIAIVKVIMDGQIRLEQRILDHTNQVQANLQGTIAKVEREVQKNQCFLSNHSQSLAKLEEKTDCLKTGVSFKDQSSPP